MIRHRMDYIHYTIWEISRDGLFEYWIGNIEGSAMLYSFGSQERFPSKDLRVLAVRGYFKAQEESLDLL